MISSHDFLKQFRKGFIVNIVSSDRSCLVVFSYAAVSWWWDRHCSTAAWQGCLADHKCTCVTITQCSVVNTSSIRADRRRIRLKSSSGSIQLWYLQHPALSQLTLAQTRSVADPWPHNPRWSPWNHPNKAENKVRTPALIMINWRCRTVWNCLKLTCVSWSSIDWTLKESLKSFFVVLSLSNIFWLSFKWNKTIKIDVCLKTAI